MGVGVGVGVGMGPPRECGSDPLVCDAELDCERGGRWVLERNPPVVVVAVAAVAVMAVAAGGIGEDCCWAE